MKLTIILLLISLPFWYKFKKDKWSNYDIPVIILSVLSGFTFMAWSINMILSANEVNNYNELKRSIKVARESGSEIERAALQNKIIEYNQDIASCRYYNKFWIIEDFIRDELTELEFIK